MQSSLFVLKVVAKREATDHKLCFRK